MNCGMTARKRSAVLTFKVATRMFSSNARRLSALRSFGTCGRFGDNLSVRAPKSCHIVRNTDVTKAAISYSPTASQHCEPGEDTAVTALDVFARGSNLVCCVGAGAIVLRCDFIGIGGA